MIPETEDAAWIVVAVMFTSAMGMRNFQANRWSWSSRSRGYVKRTKKMIPPKIIILASSTMGPTTFM